jgi:YHS domain-containing protein
MKKLKLLTTLPLLLLLISCGDDNAETSKKEDDKASDKYPLTTCVVTGEKLGSHGDPHVINHEGTTVKFCCPPCEDDFKKEPAKFLAKLTPTPKQPAN